MENIGIIDISFLPSEGRSMFLMEWHLVSYLMLFGSEEKTWPDIMLKKTKNNNKKTCTWGIGEDTYSFWGYMISMVESRQTWCWTSN